MVETLATTKAKKNCETLADLIAEVGVNFLVETLSDTGAVTLRKSLNGQGTVRKHGLIYLVESDAQKICDTGSMLRACQWLLRFVTS